MAAEVDRIDAYAALAEAVAAGDAELARRCAVDLLGAATTSLIDAIEQIERQEDA
jgi:GntR family transcriptional repressor for pyruvate dehydrogenase complex